MHKPHKRKYYVGGLISLICLPIIFWIATLEQRNKAIYYSSIQADATSTYLAWVKTLEYDSTYVFQGESDEEKLCHFGQFCNQLKKDRNVEWKVNLPQKCNYNFVVRAIVILQSHGFLCGIGKNTIKWFYRKRDLKFQQQYEPLTVAEELEYVCEEINKRITLIKEYFNDEPVYKTRVVRYSELGPPPPIDFECNIYFTETIPLRDDPRSKIYFQEIGNWFIPIILL
jgi:hypothetical protein